MSGERDQPSKSAIFRARLTSTLILWAIVTSVFVSQNAWAFVGLIGLLVTLGSLEFLSLFRGCEGRGARVVGVGVGVVVVLVGALSFVLGRELDLFCSSPWGLFWSCSVLFVGNFALKFRGVRV